MKENAIYVKTSPEAFKLDLLGPPSNNLSFPCGERKIPVCLVSKRPENMFPGTDPIFAMVKTPIMALFLNKFVVKKWLF